MAEVYGGHVVARYLKEVEEVTTVFSLSGGHIDRIYDGFIEHGIRLIDVRHEQAAAMMAQAWSSYTGGPGVCLVTAGPGFTNALTGLVNARLENAPVVFISGTSPVRDAGRGALQDMNQADMIRSYVKWHDKCLDGRRIPEYLATAFRHAVSGRPGPVFLEFPPDVLDSRVEEAVEFPKRGGIRYKCQPDPSAVLQAAELIDSAERPLIIGGNGVGASGCDRAFKTFMETAGIPFFLMGSGRGILPDDHPLSLWDGGMMGLLVAAGQADLVLALGVRFNWLLMYGQVFPQAKLVRADIEATEIDRNRAADVGLAGDLDLTLAALNQVVKKRDHRSWRRTLADNYLPLIQEELEKRQKTSNPIHPVRLVELVRQAAGDDCFYVIDGGDTSYYGYVGLKASEKASVMGPAGGLMGCLGTGIPFGLAAKAARPDKTVVVINGDGAFGLNAMEFDTAVRHNLPFICVVNNDQAWGMIKHGQELTYGPDRVIGSELGVVHYEKMAEALGGYGELVEKEEQLIPALKRAIASGKPACINVLTDPAAVSPMTLQFVDGLNMEKAS